MSSISPAQVEQALAQYIDPHLGKNLLEAKAIKNIEVKAEKVVVDIELGYPLASIRESMAADIANTVEQLQEVMSAEIRIASRIIANKTQHNLKSMENVKNIIAVASGKGGVGKSTTSVNLALALAQEGASVGLLDADIYGPSQQIMLGVEEGRRPQQHGQQFLLPIEAHGLQTMSMGYLVTEKTPMVWRGPMVSGALQQMLNQTRWDDLDYLVIDLPPGTGDIQLTLSQQVPVAGSIVVTTPQDIALLDAQKGIEMFRKVEVPVLGIVENMAIHICSECGHKEHLFGSGGGERISEDYDVPLLGSLPLSLQIREQVDAGFPTVIAEPESEVAAMYRSIARNMAAQLSLRGKNYANVFPEIVIKND